MMRCDGMAGLVARWQEGEGLEPEDLRAAAGHLDSCAACRASYGALLPLMRRDGGALMETEPPPGLEDRVMGEILGEGTPRAAHPVRRARMIAVAAVIVLALGIGGLILRPGSAARDGLITVAFVLDAPGARSVALVGDFTGWEVNGYHLERRTSDGKWTITLRLEPDRTYAYSFLVDGKIWVTDPAAGTVDDGFGGADSILRL